MTEPALNATLRAGLSRSRAASAVRTFERTATFMPMKPAAAESTAPIRKPRRSPSRACRTSPSNRNSTTATTAIVVYWRLRYAAAPCCTAREISCMRSFPAGSRRSQTVRYMP